MTKIFKYYLPNSDNLIKTHQGAKILSTGLDPIGKLCIWSMVDPNKPITKRHIRVFGTGWDIEQAEALVFIGTVNDGKGCMWHVFNNLAYYSQ